MDSEQAAQLRRVNDQSDRLLEGQRWIRDAVEELQAQMRNVLTELGGAPDVDYRDPNRLSIRARMHAFDDFIVANTLAEEALRSARTHREEGRQRTWKRGHTVAVFAITVVLMLLNVLQFFGVAPT